MTGTNAFSHPRVISEPSARELKCIEFVDFANQFPHYHGSLFDHLVGTWQILTSSKACQGAALAGLFHSIYSTEHYERAALPLSKRDVVRSLAGNRAERLAYLFCSLHKETLWDALRKGVPAVALSRFDGDKVALDDDEAAILLAIECANHIEQCSEPDGFPRPFMAWYISLARQGRIKANQNLLIRASSFTEEFEVESLSYYNQFLSGVDFIGQNAIVEASRLNPLSPELMILSQLVRSDPTPEEDHAVARGAKVLLAAWGTTWDKRLPIRTWWHVSDLMENLANTRAREAITSDLTRKLRRAQLLKG